MAVSVFTQTKSYSTNTASLTHSITLDNAVASQGGAVCPACLHVAFSYDGSAAGICTGVTDTAGNTWTKDKSTGSGTTNGEVWSAKNAVGGVAPTITITLSASQKLTGIAFEMDQVAPLRGYDNGDARVDATSGTGRRSATTTTTKRTGTHAVNIKCWMWTDATLTVSNPGSGITGLTQVKDASSNIAVGIARHNIERNQVAGSAFITTATISASTTVPVACFDLTFFRDGVVTTTDEDGTIDNLELTVTVATTSIVATTVWGCDAAYQSSTSAPYGGTGGSETDHAYAFFPDYSSYLKTGVTIGANFDVNLMSVGGADDGNGYMTGQMYLYKNNELGSTLDSGDDALPGVRAVDMGVPVAAGLQTYTVATATYYNTSGTTAMGIQMSGDSQGFTSSSFLGYGDYDMNNPAWLQLTLTYPSLTKKPPSFARMRRGIVRR
jgi:hypothetical protein